jgi:hypothetical protein
MTITDDEKRNSRDHQIDAATEPEADQKVFTEDDPNADYTGVAKKTDPEEIKLVKKLDWMIMVGFPVPASGSRWLLSGSQVY